jgi:hypothetical protein
LEKFLAWLDRIGACAAGRIEVGRYKTPQEFWEKTVNYSYLSWVLGAISNDNESVKIRVLLCMYDGLMLASHGEDTCELKPHYESLIAGEVPITRPSSWTQGTRWSNLKSRFMRNSVLYTWARVYSEIAAGDPCALIRKHFPTLPLNLGD